MRTVGCGTKLWMIDKAEIEAKYEAGFQSAIDAKVAELSAETK